MTGRGDSVQDELYSRSIGRSKTSIVFYPAMVVSLTSDDYFLLTFKDFAGLILCL